MKIKDIQQKGFYKAIDNEHFIIEVLSLDDLTSVCGITEEELKENTKSLFVDVWYHDENAPYKHDKNTYQSNGIIYKIDTIPDIFENMDFMGIYGFEVIKNYSTWQEAVQNEYFKSKEEESNNYF